VNKSQQEKKLIVCVYHNTELDTTFTDQFFCDIARITFIIHASSDEAESHVRDDAYAMLYLMLLVCSVDMELQFWQ